MSKELQDFKKEMLVRNMELVKFEITTARDIANIIAAGMTMLDSDQELSNRMDIISKRIDTVQETFMELSKRVGVAHDRLDIVNKRLRMLEEAK